MSIQPRTDVVGGCIHDPLAALLWSPGDVRGADAVFDAQQGIIRADGLGGHHVERGRCYLTAVQRVGKVLFGDDLAAAVVDDNDR